MKKLSFLLLVFSVLSTPGLFAGNVDFISRDNLKVIAEFDDLPTAWAAAINNTVQSGVKYITVQLNTDVAVDRTYSTAGLARNVKVDLHGHAVYNSGDFNEVYFDICHTTTKYAFELVDSLASFNRPYKCFKRVTNGPWIYRPDETDYNWKERAGLITGAKNAAVSVRGCTATIDKISFIGNSCPKTAGGGDGGAVRCNDGYVNLKEVRFIGNTCAGRGGALGVYGSGTNDKYKEFLYAIEFCEFASNYAAEEGGAMMLGCSGGIERTIVTNNMAGVNAGGICFKREYGSKADGTEAEACFPEGTPITMADGTFKNVEDLRAGDVIATFDHFGGTNSTAEVYYAEEGRGLRELLTLSFASGAQLTIAGLHSLLCETTRKYVTLSSDNAHDFVGQGFWNVKTGGWDRLVSVEVTGTCERFYSFYSSHHLNGVVNGLLTLTDDVEALLNFLELDENLKADEEQLAADIEEYGLASNEEYPEVPAFVFECANAKYGYIAIGKGLTTVEQLLGMVSVADYEANGLPGGRLPAQTSSALAGTPAPRVKLQSVRLQSIKHLNIQVKDLADEFGTFNAPTLVVFQDNTVKGNYANAYSNYVTGVTTPGRFASNLFIHRIDGGASDVMSQLKLQPGLPGNSNFKIGVRTFTELNSGGSVVGYRENGFFASMDAGSDYYLSDGHLYPDCGGDYYVAFIPDQTGTGGQLRIARGIQCGNDAFCELDEATGAATIRGSGSVWGRSIATGVYTWPDKYHAGNAVRVALTGHPLEKWRGKIKSITCEDTVTAVYGEAFRNFDKLESVKIANAVDGIGEYAFYQCSSLTNFESATSYWQAENYKLWYPLGPTEEGMYFPNGLPADYPIPSVKVAHEVGVLEGKVNAADAWTDISALAPAARTGYHYIRIALRDGAGVRSSGTPGGNFIRFSFTPFHVSAGTTPPLEDISRYTFYYGDLRSSWGQSYLNENTEYLKYHLDDVLRSEMNIGWIKKVEGTPSVTARDGQYTVTMHGETPAFQDTERMYRIAIIVYDSGKERLFQLIYKRHDDTHDNLRFGDGNLTCGWIYPIESMVGLSPVTMVYDVNSSVFDAQATKQYAYDSAEYAQIVADMVNADKNTYVAVPAQLKTSGIPQATRDAYCQLFTAVANDRSITLELTSAAGAKVQQDVDAAATDVLSAALDPAVQNATITATPGLYYSIEYGDTLELGKNTEGRMATATTVELEKPSAIEGDRMFLRVKSSLRPIPRR